MLYQANLKFAYTSSFLVLKMLNLYQDFDYIDHDFNRFFNYID